MGGAESFVRREEPAPFGVSGGITQLDQWCILVETVIAYYIVFNISNLSHMISVIVPIQALFCIFAWYVKIKG